MFFGHVVEVVVEKKQLECSGAYQLGEMDRLSLI